MVAWASNQSRWSLGTWTLASRQLALVAAGWVMANEDELRARLSRAERADGRESTPSLEGSEPAH